MGPPLHGLIRWSTAYGPEAIQLSSRHVDTLLSIYCMWRYLFSTISSSFGHGRVIFLILYAVGLVSVE